jgi:hypothetical protein
MLAAMRYAWPAAALAMLLASCAGTNTASTSYSPRGANPQAVRLGTNTLLLSVENSETRGYAPGSAGAYTFHQIFTQCPPSEDADVYDSASDPSGRLYVLGARPEEPGINDTCPAAAIDIWYQPVIERGDADFLIAGLETRMDHYARSIAIDSSGKIYVGDLHNVLIYATFVPGVSAFDQPPVASIRTNFAQIASVRLDRYSNVYVLGSNHVIEEFTAGASGDAKPVRSIFVPNGISGSASIAIARNGEIYTLASASSSAAASRVLVYATNGTTPVREIAGTKTGLYASKALAICADGTLYVADAASQQSGATIAGNIRLFAPGSTGNVPASIVWRRSGGISSQSLNW